MRARVVVLVTAVCAALAGPGVRAETPVWAVTHPATWARVSGTSTGTVVAVLGNGGVAVSGGAPVSLTASLAVSSDYGVTWAGVPQGPPRGGSNVTDIEVATARRWYASNGSVASVTTDAGTSWRDAGARQHVLGLGSHQSVAVAGAAQGTGTALFGWYAAGSDSRGCARSVGVTPLTVTRDGGARWRRVDLPVYGLVQSADWLDARRGVVVVGELEWNDGVAEEGGCFTTGYVTSTGVWRTTDGGLHWRRVFHVGGAGLDAEWVSPTTITVVRETRAAVGTYVSRDAGRTFLRHGTLYVPHEPFVGGWPAAIDFADDRRGWLFGSGAGIFRTENGGSEWVREPSPADEGRAGDLAALTGDRAVAATAAAVLARLGTAPATALAAPRPGPVSPVLVDTVIGPVRHTVSRPAPGALTVTVSVRR